MTKALSLPSWSRTTTVGAGAETAELSPGRHDTNRPFITILRSPREKKKCYTVQQSITGVEI